MTENYIPTAPTAYQPPYVTNTAVTDTAVGNTADAASPGTVDVAKDQAASVGQGAAAATQHVASVAKDQAQNVTTEATRQAKDLLGQARGEISSQASVQQQRLAGSLHSLADELRSMTQHSQPPGMATELAHQAADRSHQAAGWLDSREPRELLDDVSHFARQRPGAFLALAAGVGLVAGRMTRGIKAATADDSPATHPAHSSAVQPANNAALSDYDSVTYSSAYIAGEPSSPSPVTTDYLQDADRPWASSQDSSPLGVHRDSL